MVDCKFFSTPIELKLEKLCGSVVRPELENPSEFRQLVGTLMFLVNSRSDICFAVRASSHTLDCCQESLEISPGHNQSWNKIQCRECEAPWIH